MSYLLDTNVISELVKKRPNAELIRWFEMVPDDSLYLSVITLGEIRKGVEKLSNEDKKTRLRTWLEHELRDWFGEHILPIDHRVADRWGRLQDHTRKTMPAIDSLLAATALHFDLSLVTRNEKDFAYPGLEVINPCR